MNPEKGITPGEVVRRYPALYNKSFSDNHQKDIKTVGIPLLRCRAIRIRYG